MNSQRIVHNAELSLREQGKANALLKLLHVKVIVSLVSFSRRLNFCRIVLVISILWHYKYLLPLMHRHYRINSCQDP